MIETQGGSPRVTIKGLVYSDVNGGVQEIFRAVIDTGVENSVNYDFPENITISEQSILYFTAETNTNNTVVTGRFGGKLARDPDA